MEGVNECAIIKKANGLFGELRVEPDMEPSCIEVAQKCAEISPNRAMKTDIWLRGLLCPANSFPVISTLPCLEFLLIPAGGELREVLDLFYCLMEEQEGGSPINHISRGRRSSGSVLKLFQKETNVSHSLRSGISPIAQE